MKKKINLKGNKIENSAFNEYGKNSGLSGVIGEKAGDLINSLHYDRQNIIQEITGEEVNITDLEELNKFTRKELERVRKNKNLILKVTGEDKINIKDLEELNKLTIEELKNVRENKDLLTELTGEDKINVNNLKCLSKITNEELKRIIKNKKLISEIAGKFKIRNLSLFGDLGELTEEELEKFKEMLYVTDEKEIKISDSERLSRLTTQELEKLRNNKNLILEIIGKNKVSIFTLKYLSIFTKEELGRIRENKGLILEITGENKIDIDILKYLSELTTEESEKLRDNKDLIEGIMEKGLAIDILKRLSGITRQKLEDVRKNKDLILEIAGEDKISNIYQLENIIGIKKEELESIRENKNLILEVTGVDKIEISILSDIRKLTKGDLENLKNNKSLILEIIGDDKIGLHSLDDLSKLTKDVFENIKKNKDLILEITGKEKIEVYDLIDLSNLTKNNYENIKKNKDLISDIMKKPLASFMSKLKDLSEISRQNLENIINNKSFISEITGEDKIDVYDLIELSKLTKDDFENIKKICNDNMGEQSIHSISEILGINLCLKNMDNIKKNSNITKIKNYINRKHDYLENNRLIDDSEFIELFGGKGKYGKGEISQQSLGYCCMYTSLEMLKKSNFFDVLIKTNLKKSENGDGWYVRLPMGQPDGKWIHISKNEIDNTFDVESNLGFRQGISINSDSPLGFKIIEIAYIKKELTNWDEINQEYLATGDVSITGERLGNLEHYHNPYVLNTLISDYTIIKWDLPDKNFVFDNFNNLLMVGLTVKDDGINANDEVSIERHGTTSKVPFLEDVKIVSRDGNVRTINSVKNWNNKEINGIVNNNDNHFVFFLKNHYYSIERCYIDKNTGEKRVWVVNPHNTGIKFDISLQDCNKIFTLWVSYIDIDKLFR